MNIEDLLDLLNLELVVTRYPNQKNRYSASIKGAEYKVDESSGVLSSDHGNDKNPAGAINALVASIKGKLMVTGAWKGEGRREFFIPETLIGVEK